MSAVIAERRCTTCGIWMAAGVRYQTDGHGDPITVPVRICWECGEESPYGYRRTALQRNGRAYAGLVACQICGGTFQRRVDETRVHCSRRCQARGIGFGTTIRATYRRSA